MKLSWNLCRGFVNVPLFASCVFILGYVNDARADQREAESKFSISGAVGSAIDAYVYGYPLMLMDATRRVILENSGMPENVFIHSHSVPSADNHTVVRMNTDTLYSVAWLNLEAEPMVLHVPDTAGRYYILPLLDAWTNVFASPGSRTTGNGARDFVIVGPSWKGELPAGLAKIKAPTNMVEIAGRTHVAGAADYPDAIGVQEQYRLTPLSEWLPGGKDADSRVDFAARSSKKSGKQLTPPELVARMSSREFFERLSQLMCANPAQPVDSEALGQFRKFGFAPCSRYHPSAFMQIALSLVPKIAMLKIKRNMPKFAHDVNGWLLAPDSLGKFDRDYLGRATTAVFAFGSNLVEDDAGALAFVDGGGAKLSGSNKYVIHFNSGETPPVNAFWSLTLYDGSGYFAANSLNRYSIHDTDQLMFNHDGSLDLYVQTETPREAAHISNWLPSPRGAFNLALRAYWPKPQLLDGSWQPPAVIRNEN